MTHYDQNTVVVKFTPQSMNSVATLAKNLNTNPEGVIAQALALFEMVQGRKMILQDKSKAVEIKNYENQPALINSNDK